MSDGFKKGLCPRCGDEVESALLCHWEHLQCSACGWSQEGTIVPAHEIPLWGLTAAKQHLRIIWEEGEIANRSVASARSLFASLANLPFSDAVELPKQSSSYDAGIFSREQAQSILLEAEKLGLRIIAEDIGE